MHKKQKGLPQSTSDRGFTLIELLVVILIISIATSVAVLNFNRNENKQIDSFANEFLERVRLSQEMAILQPATIGLLISDSDYQFLNYEQSEAAETHWVINQNRLLKKMTIPSNVEMIIVANHSKEDDKNPNIIFSPNGEMTPFTIAIGKIGQTPRILIKGEAQGEISTERQ